MFTLIYPVGMYESTKTLMGCNISVGLANVPGMINTGCFLFLYVCITSQLSISISTKLS